jgi:hypothetical protein
MVDNKNNAKIGWGHLKILRTSEVQKSLILHEISFTQNEGKLVKIMASEGRMGQM